MIKIADRTNQHGYILTALLVFIVVILVISTTSIMISISSLRGQSHVDAGISTLNAAESGAENAILRLLRDPGYTGETLVIDGVDIELSVVHGAPIIITSIADSGAYEKTVEVRLLRTNGILELQSWKEL